jgi:hypothetical protein
MASPPHIRSVHTKVPPEGDKNATHARKQQSLPSTSPVRPSQPFTGLTLASLAGVRTPPYLSTEFEWDYLTRLRLSTQLGISAVARKARLSYLPSSVDTSGTISTSAIRKSKHSTQLSHSPRSLSFIFRITQQSRCSSAQRTELGRLSLQSSL